MVDSSVKPLLVEVIAALNTQMVNAAAYVGGTIYASSGEAASARAVIGQAATAIGWLEGAGMAGVLDETIPFSRWRVGAEGVQDSLSAVTAFTTNNSIGGTLNAIASRFGDNAAKLVTGANTTLVIVAVVLVAVIILKVL